MRIKGLNIIVTLFSLAMFSCVDKYYLPGANDPTNRLVIEGTISNYGETQEIVISRSASVTLPKFIPQEGCIVNVEDSHGNKFRLPESTDKGHYRAPTDPLFAKVGECYRLTVTVPGGDQYASPYEEMMSCPEIDSVYYKVESKATADSSEPEDGIQFYLDFKGGVDDGKYYKWDLAETYEYHSTWPVTVYVDKYDSVRRVLENYDNFVCYKTENVGDVFTLSTTGFTKNGFSKFPLHFVNNETQRLLYHYSVLVKQYTISEGAYNFWENIKKNNKESAFLYDKQPAVLKSNIRNIKDSTEVVLGYFSVSAVNTKRINITHVPGLTFNKVKYCQPFKKPYMLTDALKKLRKPGLDSIPKDRPLYYYPYTRGDGSVVWYYGDTSCFLCQLLGGTTQKPLYWDQK